MVRKMFFPESKEFDLMGVAWFEGWMIANSTWMITEIRHQVFESDFWDQYINNWHPIEKWRAASVKVCLSCFCLRSFGFVILDKHVHIHTNWNCSSLTANDLINHHVLLVLLVRPDIAFSTSWRACVSRLGRQALIPNNWGSIQCGHHRCAGRLHARNL